MVCITNEKHEYVNEKRKGRLMKRLGGISFRSCSLSALLIFFVLFFFALAPSPPSFIDCILELLQKESVATDGLIAPFR